MKRLLLQFLLLPVFMCGGGPPPAPGKPTPPPEEQDPGVTAARDNERARQRQIASNTVITGSQGDTSKQNLAVKTLLGA
jgi:hypothetical protein